MNEVVAVAIGGAIGSIARYWFVGQAGRLLGLEFPWGVMGVNILGSFIMGVLVEAMALKWDVTPEWRAFLTVGILGGFTTFSAFSADVAVLIGRGDWTAAGGYVIGSVALSILALFGGLWTVRALA
ncbi:MAG: fluoride efflux transporter CrcB [Alphaproteobacteria bacterium]|nr:fluoride efflux transporter CrcB [Alphaproteobacteria bacterium]